MLTRARITCVCYVAGIWRHEAFLDFFGISLITWANIAEILLSILHQKTQFNKKLALKNKLALKSATIIFIFFIFFSWSTIAVEKKFFKIFLTCCSRLQASIEKTIVLYNGFGQA